MSLSALISFGVVLAVATAVPGPTVAALVARVLAQGTRGIFAFCVGLVIGDVIWCGLSLLGVTVLAQIARPLFVALQYAGAVYLLWLGWKLWTAPATLVSPPAPLPGDGWRLFGAGTAIALGNPKTMMFYLALLPSLVDLAQLSPAGYAQLTAVLVVVYSGVLAGYVLLAERARRFVRSPRAVRTLNRVSGAVMAGAAVAVAIR